MHRILVLLLAATVCPNLAHAESITIDAIQGVFVRYRDPNVPTFNTATFGFGSTTVTVPGLNGGTSFEAYCVEISGDFPDLGLVPIEATLAPMSGWNLEAPSGTSRVQAATWLYTAHADDLAAADDDLARTALQMAIWNALYDDDFDVTDGAGTFFVAEKTEDGSLYGTYDDIVFEANQLLDGLDEPLNALAIAQADATWIQLGTHCDAFGCRHLQDFIGPAGPTAPVPEPATALLVLLGGAGLTTVRRSRRS